MGGQAEDSSFRITITAANPVMHPPPPAPAAAAPLFKVEPQAVDVYQFRGRLAVIGEKPACNTPTHFSGPGSMLVTGHKRPLPVLGQQQSQRNWRTQLTLELQQILSRIWASMPTPRASQLTSIPPSRLCAPGTQSADRNTL